MSKVKKSGEILDITTGELLTRRSPFRTQWNYEEFPQYKGEINTMLSMTVPDQTMSIKTILDRYARGVPPREMLKTEIWDGEEGDLPDFNKLDLSERQDAIETYQNELDEIKNKRAKKPINEQKVLGKLPTELPKEQKDEKDHIL